MLKNITLSADEVFISRAREKAMHEKTSLNKKFQEWLIRYIAQANKNRNYKALMRELSYVNAGGHFTRDEMHER